jgi:hypothetical protein
VLQKAGWALPRPFLYLQYFFPTIKKNFPHAQILWPITNRLCFYRYLSTHRWHDALQDSERLNKSVYYFSFPPKHVSLRAFRLAFVQSALIIYLLFTSGKGIVLIRTSSGPLLSVRLLRRSGIDIRSNQEAILRFQLSQPSNSRVSHSVWEETH